MSVVRPRISFADLQRAPEDGRRYELYDGEAFVVPAPLPRHQRVQLKLVEVLTEFERAAGGFVFESPIDIVLTEYNVVQPDVVFFARERVAAIDMQAAIRIPPDLAVEVLSPSTEATDRGKKMQLLARFGVREYWLVDPIDNTVEQYVLDNAAYALHAVLSQPDVLESRILSGLRFPAARLFGL